MSSTSGGDGGGGGWVDDDFVGAPRRRRRHAARGLDGLAIVLAAIAAARVIMGTIHISA